MFYRALTIISGVTIQALKNEFLQSAVGVYRPTPAVLWLLLVPVSSV
jgi:hypothetical protein